MPIELHRLRLELGPMLQLRPVEVSPHPAGRRQVFGVGGGRPGGVLRCVAPLENTAGLAEVRHICLMDESLRFASAVNFKASSSGLGYGHGRVLAKRMRATSRCGRGTFRAKLDGDSESFEPDPLKLDESWSENFATMRVLPEPSSDEAAVAVRVEYDGEVGVRGPKAAEAGRTDLPSGAHSAAAPSVARWAVFRRIRFRSSGGAAGLDRLQKVTPSARTPVHHPYGRSIPVQTTA